MATIILTPAEKITKAAVQLRHEQPFFAHIVLHMDFIEGGVDAIGVNAKAEVHYNPEFIDGLAPEELRGVIVHEALHVGFCHPLRLGARDKAIFNIATDTVVNDILISAGMKLPAGGILPLSHTVTIPTPAGNVTIDKLDEKSAEDVYALLRDAFNQQQQSGNGNGDGDEDGKKQSNAGSGGDENKDDKKKNKKPAMGFDEHSYAEDEKDAKVLGSGAGSLKQREDEMKQIMVEARNHAQSMGNMPAGLSRLVDRLLPSKVNWKALLHNVIVDVIPADFTYRRPSRKSIAAEIYLPSVVRDHTVEVTVAVDTSGSITKQMLTKFVSEIVAICGSYRGIKMTIISHGTKVYDVLKVERSDDIAEIVRWKPHGGGGTSHAPVWAWIAENAPETKLCVCLTDGETSFGEKPPYDVLWAIVPEGIDTDKVPFGVAIKLPRDEDVED